MTEPDAAPPLPQADDFRAETEALAALLDELPEADWDLETQFRGWTINDAVAHLHFWNGVVDLAAFDREAFDRVAERVMAGASRGLRAVEPEIVRDRHGRALFDAWLGRARGLAARWRRMDPKARVPWIGGPDMSARSAMTARQMETWAHGHEIFDRLGVERVEADRLRNIVVLGVNTYEWSFRVRGETPPGPMPRLALVAPSGASWEFGEDDGANRIEGPALGFAQAVTQTRAAADTGLRVEGPAARAWMERAQCFAGPPAPPPAPGARFAVRR